MCNHIVPNKRRVVVFFSPCISVPFQIIEHFKFQCCMHVEVILCCIAVFSLSGAAPFMEDSCFVLYRVNGIMKQLGFSDISSMKLVESADRCIFSALVPRLSLLIWDLAACWINSIKTAQWKAWGTSSSAVNWSLWKLSVCKCSRVLIRARQILTADIPYRRCADKSRLCLITTGSGLREACVCLCCNLLNVSRVTPHPRGSWDVSISLCCGI